MSLKHKVTISVVKPPLVPESDKRNSINVSTAKNDFMEVI